MTITVTSLKLRSVWLYFKLTWLAMHIVKKTKQEKGFVKLKSTGFGYLHYTLSAWQSIEDMKRFYLRSAHKDAMKESRNLSTEIKTYSYSANEMPSWKDAKQMLNEKGKSLHFK